MPCIGKTLTMPDTIGPLTSAVDLLAAFRSREVSPVEHLDAAIARVEALDTHYNAVIDRRYDEARAEARASAHRYVRGEALPLDGLPVAAKEEHPMVGRSWSQGSLVYESLVADVDHPVIERIQAAGGIIHIRTSTPEFCCTPYCHSRLWGVTRNPWNPEYSPGGSSGGTGVALAAGYAALGTGSDIGGSIRIPASLSGVAGFKAPWQRIPALAPYNLDQYCHDGPMARTVADCALLEEVIAGQHWLDPVSLPDPPAVTRAGDDVRGLRVALCLRLGDWPLDAGVEAATLATAAALEAAGAHVEEVTLPWTTEFVWETVQAHFRAIMGAGVGQIHDEHAELLSDYTVAFARELGQKGPGFYDGLESEGALWRPVADVFRSHDVLLCPTMATEGYLAGEPYLDGMDVGGQHLVHHLLGAMTVPFNVLSRCPVMSVPSGLSPNGVPTGVQVVARPYDDLMAFRVAAAVERLRPLPPCPVVQAP